MKRLARLLGCTEGQAYSAVIVAVVATALVLVGVPPALRHQATQAAAAVAPARAGEPPPRAAGAPAPGVPAAAAPTVDAAPFPPPPYSNSGPPTLGETAGPRTTRTFADVAAPAGVALVSDGRVVVASGDAIVVYDKSGRVSHRYRLSGDVATVAVDDGDHVIVVAGTRVVRLALADGHQEKLATIPDLPVCAPVVASACEPGVQDHPPQPRGVARDDRGRVYVADAGQATIWAVDPGARDPQPWYGSLDLASGDGPSGIALDDGHVLFTAGTSLDVNAIDEGALYDLIVAGDRTAGARTLIATYQRGAAPSAVVVAASGRIYVALAAADAIGVIGPDHVAQTWITDSIDAPAALALGDGRLLVADRSHTDRGRVIEIPVDDGPR